MNPQIKADIEYLESLQRRMIQSSSDDPAVRKCLDRVYAEARQAIEALNELDAVWLNIAQTNDSQ
jgi:hypothetical protein